MLAIRPARAADVPTILNFIRLLAEYERMPESCVATEQSLAETLFGPRPFAEAWIAEWNSAPAGFALFFHNYSTWLAQPGLYLEDLFVLPELRGHGIGKALLQRLAAIAVERGCGRMEWSVLDWNSPAIDFYRAHGAEPLDEWSIFRLTGDALTRFAHPGQGKQDML